MERNKYHHTKTCLILYYAQTNIAFQTNTLKRSHAAIRFQSQSVSRVDIHLNATLGVDPESDE